MMLPGHLDELVLVREAVAQVLGRLAVEEAELEERSTALQPSLPLDPTQGVLLHLPLAVADQVDSALVRLWRIGVVPRRAMALVPSIWDSSWAV